MPRPEPLDARLQVTAPHEWAMLAVLALVCGGLLLWGFLGNIERSLNRDAVLIAPGERYAVVAHVSGAVSTIEVAIGQPLRAGQTIARVRPRAGGKPLPIISPVDGELMSHHLAIGQPVADGEVVAQVRQSRSGNPVAVAFVSASDAISLKDKEGQLKPNMAARLYIGSTARWQMSRPCPVMCRTGWRR